MADKEGGRGCGGLLFVLALVVLSAAAIWFVEWERPRQEGQQVGRGRTATERVRQTATSRVRQTATMRARQIATAQAQQAATVIALEHPDIWLRVLNDPDGERLHLEAKSNLRLEGRLEIVIYDDGKDEEKTFVVTFSANERGYLRLKWKYPLSGNAIKRKHMIDRVEGVFKPTGADKERLNCVKNANTSPADIYSCNHVSGSRVWPFTVKTATARARRTATAGARQTTTALARQTATERVRLTAVAEAQQRATSQIQTATARSRTATAYAPTAAAQTRTAIARRTATSRANRTATEVSRRTATAYAPTGAVLTRTASIRRTATTSANQTATESYQRTTTARISTVRAQQTATASARPTSTPRPTTYYVRHTNLVNVRACASTECAQVGTLPSGTAIRVFRVEEGKEWKGDSRWLAFDYEGEMRYLHALLASRTRPTNTPRPTAVPTRDTRTRETYYVSNFGGANVRECPRFSCGSVTAFTYRSAVTVVGEVTGDVYEGSRRWKEVEYGGRVIYIHASLLSRNQPASPSQNNSGGSGSSGGSSGGLGGGRSQPPSDSRSSYPGLYCYQIRERYGDGNFTRDHPAYTSSRDRDDDGIACEK